MQVIYQNCTFTAEQTEEIETQNVSLDIWEYAVFT